MTTRGHLGELLSCGRPARIRDYYLLIVTGTTTAIPFLLLPAGGGRERVLAGRRPAALVSLIGPFG